MGAKEDFNDVIESEEEWEERMGSLRCVVEYLKQRPKCKFYGVEFYHQLLIKARIVFSLN